MVELINTALMRTAMAAGRLRQRFSEERGQDLMEYALLGGLIAAGLAAAFAAVLLTDALDTMAAGIVECLDFDDVCPGP